MIDYAEKLRVVQSLAFGKNDYLDRVRDRKIQRPDHEVERVRRELTVLREIASDYERAIAKAEAE